MGGHGAFDAASLLDRKGNHTITVALPAKDEEATIGPTVELINRELVEEIPPVDELLVIDDLSTDNTAAIAEKAGATVWSGRRLRYGSAGGACATAPREALALRLRCGVASLRVLAAAAPQALWSADLWQRDFGRCQLCAEVIVGFGRRRSG